jgi:hypothetical protein
MLSERVRFLPRREVYVVAKYNVFFARDADWKSDSVRVNAMSTRIRHFGAVGVGQNGAVSFNV